MTASRHVRTVAALLLIGWTGGTLAAEAPPAAAASPAAPRVAKVKRVKRTAVPTARTRRAAPPPLGVAPSRQVRMSAGPRPIGKKTRGDVRAIYQKVAPATVVVVTERGHGTGIILSADGLVLTNHHVANGGAWAGLNRTVRVQLGALDANGVMARGDVKQATVLKWDEGLDLALLRIDAPPPSLPFVPLAAANPTPGEAVSALGHAGIGLLWAIKSGEIAAMGTLADSQAAALARPTGTQEADLPPRARLRVIQSTCTLAPGDSGGPLVNPRGELVGVNDFIKGDADMPVTSNFHIDVREVRAFLADVPTAPMVDVPVPHEVQGRVITGDVDDDGKVDSLAILGEEEKAILVDATEEGPPARLLVSEDEEGNEVIDAARFRASFAVVVKPDGIFTFYDTDGDGRFDVLLRGDGPEVKAGYRLVPGPAVALAPEALPTRIVSAGLFKNPDASLRVARVMARAAPALMGAEEVDAFPDPFADWSTAVVSDLDDDGVSDLLIAGGDLGAAYFLAPPAPTLDLDGGLDVAEAPRALAPSFAFVHLIGRTLAYYDQNADGKLDLLFEVKGTSVPIVAKAWRIDGEKPVEQPDQVGRLALRPELVPAALRERFAFLAAEVLQGAVAGPSAAESFPLPARDAWASASSRRPSGFKGSLLTLEGGGAEAVVADFDGRLAKLAAAGNWEETNPLPEGAPLGGPFFLFRANGVDWAAYDTNLDGKTDLVLLSTSDTSMRADTAYTLSKDGAVRRDAKREGGPMFLYSAFATPAARASMKALIGALGVVEEAREP